MEHREFLNKTGQKLEAVLRLVLNDDKLAAQAVHQYLIQHIYNRRPDLPPLGNFPLNISGVSKDTAKLLIQVLVNILPSAFPFKMTVDNLMNATFQPKKNHETGELE